MRYGLPACVTAGVVPAIRFADHGLNQLRAPVYIQIRLTNLRVTVSERADQQGIWKGWEK
jgi:hypothetical protein